MAACVKYQNKDGLWHQEMTREDSYVETSGTGLMLYAIGRGLELGLLPESYRENFLRGLRGYLGYIALDGSVFNTCQGCLCPGKGTIEDYIARPWQLNDVHSFGPAALTFAQALKLGISEVAY
jgi:unsaturated rhamnogalacturonyl hydrolase